MPTCTSKIIVCISLVGFHRVNLGNSKTFHPSVYYGMCYKNCIFSGITCLVPVVYNGVADPVAGTTGDYGSTYSIQCNTGYQPGSAIDTSGSCGDNVSFNAPEPICESKLPLIISLCHSDISPIIVLAYLL